MSGATTEISHTAKDWEMTVSFDKAKRIAFGRNAVVDVTPLPLENGSV